MKQVYMIMMLLGSVLQVVTGQLPVIDSLKKSLAQTKQDTSRVLLLVELAGNYQFFEPDTAMTLCDQALDLAQRLKFPFGEIRALTRLGEILRLRGEYPQALEEHQKALRLSRQIHDAKEEAGTMSFEAIIYIEVGEFRRGLTELFRSREIYEDIPPTWSVLRICNIGNAYEKLNMLDSAEYFQQMALNTKVIQSGLVGSERAHALIFIRLGIIQNRKANYPGALYFQRQALQTANISGDLLNRSRSEYQMAEVFRSINKADSSLHFALLAFTDAQRAKQKTILLSASNLMAQFYKNIKNLDSAYFYQKIAMETKDSLFGAEKFQRLQVLTLNEQQRVLQLQEEQERSKAALQRTGLLLALGAFLLIALMLWRTTRQQLQANRILNRKNNQIEKQRNELEQTLTELKVAQAQLVQQEKMASLGELSAGIAHEIQNPLNFVNNFSEVNTELIDEMKAELAAGKIREGIQIADSIRQNEQKIIDHGKRADAIVKGMLFHSRETKGQKELTNINAITEEYLRLSYQGLRARDNSFSATLKTDFDLGIHKVNIIPQDIGRVLLNLYNNAFYAISEKKNQLPIGYEPIVTVNTREVKDKVEIRVKDNGFGISQKVIDKIFQPFFTTKPTGQGTGLGLSLSYDIIKAHGGEIKVESTQGEGAEFIIQLPII